MVGRVATGMQEFDSLVDGGFPEKSTVLLTGAPGTGKSIFGLQYLYNGIKNGENGIYVYAESHLDSIKTQALQMGFDMEKMQRDGKLVLINVPIDKSKFDLLYVIEDSKERIGAKRLVFDSLATFTVNIDLFTIPAAYAGSTASEVVINEKSASSDADDESRASTPGDVPKGKIYYRSDQGKRIVYLTLEILRNLGTTNLIITFSGKDEKQITIDGISEFVSDGIVEFYNELIGAKHIRTFSILKMRNTNHSQYIHDFEISDKGIIIKPAEQVYK
ncbi:MAG: RAD55 family ATPase [Candidatus Micrarchaeaceae archaeon]